MLSNLKTIVSIAALSLAASSASAAFIDKGSYLTDTDTGLDWLDVTASINRSYNDVASQFGMGGDFDGWRYASVDEFNTLLAGYTGLVNSGFGRVSVANDEILDELVQILGDTLLTSDPAAELERHTECGGYGCSRTGVKGLLGGNIESPRSSLGRINDLAEANNDGVDFFATIEGFVSRERMNVTTGSFLVRETNVTEVSEPATFALLGLGLAGLGFARRRR